MENKLCKVTVNGSAMLYPEGTSLLRVSQDCTPEKGDFILASVNGRLSELTKHVASDCEVELITTASVPGIATYTRGVVLMMMRAFYRVFDKDEIDKINVSHTIGSGTYCTFKGRGRLSPERINLVKLEMRELVERDLPFEKHSIKTRDAEKLFADCGMTDKADLFRYRRVSNTNIYCLDGYIDYFYGYMPASTGILRYFDLIPYEDGFVLMIPTMQNPESIEKFVPREKFFRTQMKAEEWGDLIGCSTVGSLNRQITEGNISDLILVQEAMQEKQIGDIAHEIREAGSRKFILIAGPSSSGKTTMSHRLSIQLRTLGLKPHPIALDDYFKNREDTPRDESGDYDFECLEALDVEGFNRDMNNLLDGQTVEMPTFNFKTGQREYRGNTLKLGPDDILVIEGIHGLDDRLSYSLPKESGYRIYISALTAINIDEHNRIPTTDGRLLRRIVRDARTRGATALDTIRRWPSVRRGEERYIFPFQEGADAMFNSALIYELAVLKQFAEPLLFAVPEDGPEFVEAKRLLKFLDYFLGVSSEGIPSNSILREFVGGSVFNV